MTNRFAQHLTNEELRLLIAAADAAVEGGADAAGPPPDPWPNGEPDPQWEHPAAAAARDLSSEYGLSWEFTTWAEFAALLRGIIDERE